MKINWNVSKVLQVLPLVLLGFVQPSFAQQNQMICPDGPAKRAADGSLKLALIVGINDYAAVRDLNGAVNDASKIYRLITSLEVKDESKRPENAFPTQNVCLLTDRAAKTEVFKEKFQSSLIDRARDENGAPADQVLIYFAGHGAKITDDNGDEVDQLDETLLLHDSYAFKSSKRRERIAPLRDDQFNSMLKALHEKTPNISVILDSCHSGTAARGVGENSRYVDVDDLPELTTSDRSIVASDEDADGSQAFAEFTPFSLPGAVFLSAARDLEPAVERGGEGVFTKALIEILRRQDRSKITYDQLFARIKSELGVSARQTPVLSGSSNKFVFTNDIPYVPAYDWTVLKTDNNTVTITGLPTSDIGEGAEFLILPGSITANEAKEPNIAKARMKAVSSPSSNEWVLEKIKDFNRDTIKSGDFAELVLPAPNARKLRVRIRPANENNGVAKKAELQTALIDQKSSNLRQRDIKKLEFVNSGFEFEIIQSQGVNYQILDNKGLARNIYEGADPSSKSLIATMSSDLANHLRQINLLTGWKVSGGSMVPNETLQVWLEPVSRSELQRRAILSRSKCKEDYPVGRWIQAEANAPQDVPLCAIYKIKAALSADAKVPVNIAGSVLSADGRMNLLWTLDQTQEQQTAAQQGKRIPIELAPGGSAELAIFQATPNSLLFEEYIYVLALPAIKTGNTPPPPIPWNLLETMSGSSRSLDGTPEREYGTYSIVPVRTIANAEFRELTKEQIDRRVATREYTIKEFDIAPYLPDEKNSALYRVLIEASKLTNKIKTPTGFDGVPYKQHNWCEGSEEKNLEVGIDCSRSIWFAFTRAGLPYNRYTQSIPETKICQTPFDLKTDGYDPKRDGYLYTGDMARKDYLMSDEFEDCLTRDESGKRALQLGDILVYRDSKRGDGHTVMVIDPEKRIAWGSHGWDGNPRLKDPVTGSNLTADLGVEFQKIKIKPDWERWDRSTMKLKACWRHKAFTEERKNHSGIPGLAAICRSALLENTDYFKNSLCGSYVN